jgi:hypothetical protein
LLDAINIEEFPFFLQNTDTYTRLDYAAMNARVVKPFFAARDKKIAIINQSAISLNDKKLITAEVKYATNNLLYELADLGAENKTAIDKVMDDVFGLSLMYFLRARNTISSLLIIWITRQTRYLPRQKFNILKAINPSLTLDLV